MLFPFNLILICTSPNLYYMFIAMYALPLLRKPPSTAKHAANSFIERSYGANAIFWPFMTQLMWHVNTIVCGGMKHAVLYMKCTKVN